MRYDKYQKKINRINKVLNLAYRGRFIIIAAVSAALVTTFTLISTKGIVTESEPFAERFTYGDIINYEASAFMNSAKAEYAKKDSDVWSEIAPKYAGEYKMRCYSYDGWGNRKYGPTHNFVIEPYATTMTFSVSQFKYGETPRATLNLNSGDTLSSYEVIYDDLFSEELKTKAHIDPSSVKITNAQGEDVSYCYSISSIETELQVLSRSIEVSLNSEEPLYDGKEHHIYGGEITSGSLADGDEIDYGEGITLKDPETKVNVGPLSIKHGDKDVTHLYTINKLTKDSSIKKIPYSISSLDVNRIYNGKTTLENKDLEFTFDCPNFVSTHRFEFTHNEEIDDIYINEDPLSIEFDFHIYDGEEDVTDKCYVLEEKNVGKLTIGKTDLYIESSSLTKTYDGIEFSNDGFTQTGLVEGDTLTVTDSLILPNYVFGTFDNTQRYSLTREIDGEIVDVSSCYNISLSFGSLNIERRHLEIEMPSFGTIKYDGKVRTLNQFKILDDGEDLEKYQFSLKDEPISFVDSGIYNCDKNEVIIRLDNIDVTNCFDINYTYFDTIVTKREITANLKSFSTSAVIYDGKDHTVGTIEIGGDGLAETDSIRNSEVAFRNVGSYYLSSEDIGFDVVDTNERSVLNLNYEFEWSCETIQIDPRQINVTLPTTDEPITYDATNHTFNFDKTQFSGDNALVDGHEITVNPDPYTVKDAGSYNIQDELGFSITVHSNDEDVTENYDIHIIEDTGNIDIAKRKTTVTYPTYNAVYDGQSHILQSPTATNLATNHVVKFAPKAMKDVKKYGKNDVASDSFDSLGNPIIIDSLTGEDVSRNYEITCVFNESEITPKEIAVSLDNYVDVYDGKAHDVKTFTYVDGKTPVNGHVLTISNYISITDVGEYTNLSNDPSKRAKVNIVDENGVNVESNYSITLTEKGKSTISALEIPVTVNGFSEAYSGLRYFDMDGHSADGLVAYDSTLLPEGWGIKIDKISNPYFGKGNMQDVINVKTVNDSLTTEVKDKDIRLNVTYKPYEIFKRNLCLTCKNSKKTYDGIASVLNDTQAHLIPTDATPLDISINNLKYNYTNLVKLEDSVVGVYKPQFLYDDLSIINLGIDEIYLKDTKQYFNIDFTACANKYTIIKRSLSLQNAAIEEVETGLPQSEEILISGLVTGEKLYFEFTYTDDGGVTQNVKEEIIAGKKLYDCVVDNINPGIYRYTLVSGANIISQRFFSVYRDNNGVERKINDCYSISFTSNPIIINSNI